MDEQNLAKYEGWAIVEIMGHQRCAGHVTTQYFGSVAILRVVQAEVPAEEVTIDRDRWMDGERVYAGSKIRISRPRAETYVAASALYRLTPCTEAEALAAQPSKVEIIERAERKQIATSQNLTTFEDSDDDDSDDDDDPDVWESAGEKTRLEVPY